MRTLFLLLAWLSLSVVSYTQTLVAYYPFNGNANDQSGNAINPTYIGSGVTLTTDRFGNANKAYNFDGLTNSYMRMPSDLLPTANRTVSVWFKVPDVSNRPTLLGYGGNSPAPPGTSFFMGLNLEGCGCYRTAGHWPGINTASHTYTSAPVNNWFHFVITINGNTIKIYINGNLSTTAAGTFSSNTIVASKDFSLGVGVSSLGVAPYTDVNMGYFKGSMDEVRIYDIAMSDAQVQQLYQTESTGLVAYFPFNGNTNDESGNGNNGTVNGVSFTSDRFNNNGRAVQFNGTSSVITVKDTPQLRLNNELTLTAWVKRTRFGIDMIFEKGGDWTGGTTNYGLGLHQINNNMFYFFFKGGWRGTSGINDFEWHHYTVVAKNAEADPQLYIDGVPKSVQYRDGAATMELFQSTADLHLGAQLGANIYYGANVLDEIKVYNRRLSAAEILQNYKQEASGLVAYYPFNGNANDESGNGKNGTVNGATLTTDRFGNVNNAYNFVNPNHISVLNSSMFGNEFTVSYWFKIGSYFGQRAVMSNVAVPNGGFQQQFDGTTFSYILGYNFPQTNDPLFSNYTMQEPLSKWHHLAVTYKKTGTSSSESKLFINGELKKSSDHIGLSILFTPDAPFYIGQNHGGLNFQGDLDDIRIYNRVLSPNEISQLADIPLMPNLLIYLPLNGNTRDMSGNQRNGTSYGGATVTTDKYNNANAAYFFTGADCGINLSNTNSLDFTGKPFAISAWVKYSNITGPPSAIVGKHNCGTPNGYVLAVENNIPQFYLSTGGWSITSATQSYNDNKWHHLVATYDGTGSQKLYVDGELKASASSVVYNNPSGSGTPIIIGDANGSCTSGTFSASIDEVKIYGAELNAAQITALYKQSRGSGIAVRLEGNNTNHILITENLDPPPAITLEAWVQAKGTSGRQWILAGSAVNTWQWGIEGNKIVLGNLNGTEVLSADVALDNGKWNHLAVSYSSGNVAFYFNGMPAGTGTITPAGSVSGSYAIGNRAGAFQSFDGLLDEIRLWGAALSQSIIRNWMNRKITPSHPNYDNMGYYFNFDEVSLSKVYDLRQGVPGIFTDGGNTMWSGAPIGDTCVTDFTSTVKSASIPYAVNEQLTATVTSGNPDGIAVYLVKDAPVSLSGTNGVGGNDHYYGVSIIGGTNPQYSAVYQYGGNALVTPLLEPSLALFKRPSNSVLQWTNSSAVLNTTAKTLTITGEATEYILGTTGYALAVEERVPGAQPVLVYPNPAQLHVTLKGVEQFSSLQLFDMTGKLILERRNNQQPIIYLNLLGLKSGLYILRLLDRSEAKTIKLIIGN